MRLRYMEKMSTNAKRREKVERRTKNTTTTITMTITTTDTNRNV